MKIPMESPVWNARIQNLEVQSTARVPPIVQRRLVINISPMDLRQWVTAIPQLQTRKKTDWIFIQLLPKRYSKPVAVRGRAPGICSFRHEVYTSWCPPVGKPGSAIALNPKILRFYALSAFTDFWSAFMAHLHCPGKRLIPTKCAQNQRKFASVSVQVPYKHFQTLSPLKPSFWIFWHFTSFIYSQNYLSILPRLCLNVYKWRNVIMHKCFKPRLNVEIKPRIQCPVMGKN